MRVSPPPARTVSIILLLALSLAPLATAQDTSAYFLWEGETAHVGNTTHPEDVTVISINEQGTEAVLTIHTRFDTLRRTVRDDQRVAYVYRTVDGTERYRSVLIQDVAKKPPRVKIWLPSGAEVETVSIFQKVLRLLARLF